LDLLFSGTWLRIRPGICDSNPTFPALLGFPVVPGLVGDHRDGNLADRDDLPRLRGNKLDEEY